MTTLCEAFNVTHRDDENIESFDKMTYGRGRVVGMTEKVVYDDKSKSDKKKDFCLVIWENERSVSPSYHTPDELINAVDFDSFEDSDEDDEDEDDDDSEEIDDAEIIE